MIQDDYVWSGKDNIIIEYQWGKKQSKNMSCIVVIPKIAGFSLQSSIVWKSMLPDNKTTYFFTGPVKK